MHLKKASLVGAFFVFAIFSLQAQALCSVSDPLSRVAVAKVIDGDTLRLVDGRSVRLIGLNAPEMGRKDRGAEPFAEAARRRLQVLISASDGRVGLRLGQEVKDHYGRVLAHAFDERGENLEAALLAEGLGYFVAIAPKYRIGGLSPSRRAAGSGRRQRSMAPVASNRSRTLAPGWLRGGECACRSTGEESGRYLAGAGRLAGIADSSSGRCGVHRVLANGFARQRDRGEGVGD